MKDGSGVVSIPTQYIRADSSKAAKRSMQYVATFTRPFS